MQTFFIIMSAFFLITGSLFIIFYFRLNEKYKKEKKEHTEVTDKYKLLYNDINRLKDELSTKRIGYYTGTLNLMRTSSDKKGDTYAYNIHVKEMDRYTNGMSKIKLIDVEVVSGFSPQQYNYVKNCVKDNFSTVRKTSDIEWLESEETTKEQRREKLEKLKELESKL